FARFGGDALLQGVVEVAQRLLGLDLLGHVRIGAEPANDLARLVADRQGAREEPPVGTVAPAQGKRVLPGRAVLEAAADAADDAVDVIGMMHLLPAPALHLLERRARVVVPAPVVPVDPALLVRRPGELADVVGKLAEARLAVAQRLLGAVARG